MKPLVWTALAVAGIGYWWYVSRHLSRHNVAIDHWTEQDGADTAAAIAKLYEKTS
jgi:hypothetical protein